MPSPSSPIADPDEALVMRLRCPACGGALRYHGPGVESQPRAACIVCHASYRGIRGVWRMLTPEQQEKYRAFLENYTSLRQREGWERDDAYYLGLPYVQPNDPAAHVWRIRRRSLGRLETLLSPASGAWALDLGAGNGWLTRRLAKRGYNAVALDLNSAQPEGLEGGRVYLERGEVRFERVQGSMDLLPFKAASFALCTVSGALHYTDLAKALSEIWRVLEQGGMLIISDSPVYSDVKAGQQMAHEQRLRAEFLLGHPAPRLPGGTGFLVGADVRRRLESIGFAVCFVSIERLPGRLRRRLRKLLNPGRREEARFPLIVGVKGGGSALAPH